MATSAGASQALRDGGGMQMQVSCSMFEASSLKFFNLLFLGSNSDLFFAVLVSVSGKCPCAATGTYCGGDCMKPG
jgi:hypothetical protein